MTYLFTAVAFPDESRIGSIWSGRWADDVADGHVAIGHLIHLPDGQDVDVESDFLSSHLPFHCGGFGGVYADGSPWVFVLQHGPPNSSTMLIGDADPFWAMRDSLDRALSFNPGAQMTLELRWTRAELAQVYADRGVDPGALRTWSIASLLRGLLAECCYVPLPDIVDGYATGCAFPEIEHACEADVFNDVFARWVAQLIRVPTTGSDGDDELVEEIDGTTEVHSTPELMTLTGTRTLEELGEFLVDRTGLDSDLWFNLDEDDPEAQFIVVIIRQGVGLDFPFSLDELCRAITELEHDIYYAKSPEEEAEEESPETLEKNFRALIVGIGEGNVVHAKSMATHGHEGQFDEAGRPYIEHPERVVGHLVTPTEPEVIVAWLHDVVTNTYFTLEDIRAAFGPQVADAVDAISHRPDELNVDYYARVMADPTARTVKIADLADSVDFGRSCAISPARRAELDARYAAACRELGLEEFRG